MEQHQENSFQVKTECFSESSNFMLLDTKHLRPQWGQLTKQDDGLDDVNNFSTSPSISTLQFTEDGETPTTNVGGVLKPDVTLLQLPQAADNKSDNMNNFSTDQNICTFTGDRDSSSTSMDLVQEMQDQKKVYACKMCSYSCDLLYQLYKHTVSHLMEKGYTCDLCQSSYEYFLDLKSHLLSHVADVKFSPELCHGKGQYVTNTEKLQMLKPENEMFEDTLIDEQGINLREVKYKEEKSLSCDKCNYACSHEQDFETHKRRPLSGKHYIILALWKVASPNITQKNEQTEINVHKKTHMDKKTCNPWEYNTCSPTYDLKRPQEIKHKDEKKYLCDLCGYTFARSWDLKMHLRRHTGERPYSCNLCDYTCIKSSYLKVHHRSHTGEKPYSCNLCEFTCTNSSGLKAHQRTHTGEWPYFNVISVNSLVLNLLV